MSPSKDDAKRAGRQALTGLRGTLAQGVARLLKRDPDLLSEMVELGLVRHEWLDDPTSEPVSTAFALCWMAERVLYQELVQGAPIPPQDLVEALVRIWMRTIYER